MEILLNFSIHLLIFYFLFLYSNTDCNSCILFDNFMNVFHHFNHLRKKDDFFNNFFHDMWNFDKLLHCTVNRNHFFFMNNHLLDCSFDMVFDICFCDEFLFDNNLFLFDRNF